MTGIILPLLQAIRDGDEDWRWLARCAEVGGDLWFPERGGNARPAKRICRVCEVRERCLQYALVNGIEHGVWGGLSASQREHLRLQNTRDQEGRAALCLITVSTIRPARAGAAVVAGR